MPLPIAVAPLGSDGGAGTETSPVAAGGDSGIDEGEILSPLQSLRSGKLPLSLQAQKICIAVFVAVVLLQCLRVLLRPADQGDAGGAYAVAVANLKTKLLDPVKATFPSNTDSGVTITPSGNDFHVDSFVQAGDATGKISKVSWHADVHRNVGNSDYTVLKLDIDPAVLAQAPASAANATPVPSTSAVAGATAASPSPGAAPPPGATPAPGASPTMTSAAASSAGGTTNAPTAAPTAAPAASPTATDQPTAPAPAPTAAAPTPAPPT